MKKYETSAAGFSAGDRKFCVEYQNLTQGEKVVFCGLAWSKHSIVISEPYMNATEANERFTFVFDRKSGKKIVDNEKGKK